MKASHAALSQRLAHGSTAAGAQVSVYVAEPTAVRRLRVAAGMQLLGPYTRLKSLKYGPKVVVVVEVMVLPGTVVVTGTTRSPRPTSVVVLVVVTTGVKHEHAWERTKLE
jgi:hypothetical protein